MTSGEASEEIVSETVDDDGGEDSATAQSSRTESEPDAAIKQVLGDDEVWQPNDDVDDNDDDDDDFDDSEGIPWHHMQLYKLYGDEADYFLHPKTIGADKHASIKPSKLLKSLCGECSADSTGRKLICSLSLWHSGDDGRKRGTHFDGRVAEVFCACTMKSDPEKVRNS